MSEHSQSHAERKRLIRAARKTLDEVGLLDVPVVAGIGASSTRESVRLAQEAADAGADFVLAIFPGYYASSLATDQEALELFFVEVAEASPVPVYEGHVPSFVLGTNR